MKANSEDDGRGMLICLGLSKKYEEGGKSVGLAHRPRRLAPSLAAHLPARRLFTSKFGISATPQREREPDLVIAEPARDTLARAASCWRVFGRPALNTDATCTCAEVGAGSFRSVFHKTVPSPRLKRNWSARSLALGSR